ncbi:MAG: hypothetical protein IT566_12230 [Rhodospirillaceae bacterium]|nr:hypothetical protein [Rhodospirillaceae bacterium]
MTNAFPLSRRTLLAGAACAPFAARAASAGLRVLVRLDGETFTYTADGAEDLGAFASPAGFTQNCLRATQTRGPLTVYFRPDQTSDRLEVVFERGRLWDGAPANLGPYSAEIQSAGKTRARVEVPRHLWFSRWRWQSDERPVKADISALKSRGLIPPFARRTFARPAPPPKSESYRVMELAGVQPRMGSTGERPDIGLVTEQQARFLCTEARDALTALRGQAEAAGTLPWHMRDERTGAPVDLDTYKTMSWYGDRNVGDPHIDLADTGISIDSAHQPALAYVPYLLTGDPYHLEDLQFAANYNRGALPPPYRLSIPQPRSFAWSIRTLAQAANVTPDKTPRWLLPAGYFRSDLDRTRKWFEATYVESQKPLHKIFRATDNPDNARDEPPQAPGGTWISPWQHEFIVAALGWAVLMGFDAWRKSFQWALGGTLDRVSGHSGWRRSHPSPYRLIVKAEKNGAVAGSWDEAWKLSSVRARWPEQNDALADGDPTYAIYTRGALAMAARLGVKDAEAPLAWITDQLRRQDAAVPYKWLLA